MTIKLNLLPAEYVVSSSLGKVLKTTRSLGVILLAAFLIFVLGLGAFFIISTIQLNSVSNVEVDLKNQIAAREQSETQIILLKDRLKKIKTAQGLPSSFKTLDNIDPIITAVSGSASLTELSVDSGKADISINFKSNADLANFLGKMNSIKNFKTVTMTTFGFNPTSGYIVSIRLL